MLPIQLRVSREQAWISCILMGGAESVFDRYRHAWVTDRLRLVKTTPDNSATGPVQRRGQGSVFNLGSRARFALSIELRRSKRARSQLGKPSAPLFKAGNKFASAQATKIRTRSLLDCRAELPQLIRTERLYTLE